MSIPFLLSSVVQKNVSLLAGAFGIEQTISLRRAYEQVLAHIQGWDHSLDPDDGPSIFFHGAAERDEVFSHFLTGYDLPVLAPFDEAEVSALTATVTESLNLLTRLDGDAGVAFDLLIHVLLVVRIPAFGSRSDALGLVIAGPEADWSRLEIAELLWHEAVHQALFLEDLVEPLFSVEEGELVSPEAYVRNPLLGMNRPFDLAFHGVAVSIAILDLHLRAGSCRRAIEMLPSVAPSLAELTARRHLLTKHGAEILDDLVTAAGALTSEVAELSARGMQERGERPSRRSYLELQPSWRARS